MNKKISIVLSAICITASLVTGCQSLYRAKPANVSPFIPKPELLVKQKATFPFHYFYMKPNAGNYEKVYIAPVDTSALRKNKDWAKVDQAMAETLGSDIKKIAKNMQQDFKKAFKKSKGKKKLQVVDSPDGDKTLIVETAIVGIVPTKAELVILGTAGNLLLPGIGIITQNLALGSTTIECVIRDAKTKEIIVMYSNTENTQRAIINVRGMTWYGSAEKNIRQMAERTAKIFSGSDYSYTWRMLIKLIEL